MSSSGAVTPIASNARSKQMRRVPLADAANTLAARSAPPAKATRAAIDRSNESNSAVDSDSAQQLNFESTPRPRRLADASLDFQNFNGSFDPMRTPIARTSPVVSVLTVERVRASLASHSHSAPLLPSPARANAAAARQYSQEALLLLKDSPLIRVGDDCQVPVGPWSPGRVSRPAARSAVLVGANAQQTDSVKNLSALFEASTIQESDAVADAEPQQQPVVDEPEPDEPQDEHAALQRRQRQIDITKQSALYLAYVSRRAREQRLPSDPRTPRVTQRCSKRAWLGQLAKWRRDLHALANGHAPSPLKPLSPDAANSREFTPTPPRS